MGCFEFLRPLIAKSDNKGVLTNCEEFFGALEKISGKTFDLNKSDGKIADLIRKKLVRKFDFTTFTKDDIVAAKADPKCVILQFTNCPNVNAFLCKLREEDLYPTLKRTTQLFAVLIHTREALDESVHYMISSKFKFDSRPLVVQVSSELKERVLYIKEEKQFYIYPGFPLKPDVKDPITEMYECLKNIATNEDIQFKACWMSTYGIFCRTSADFLHGAEFLQYLGTEAENN